MDLPARERWYDYSLARDQMLDATDTGASPWRIVRSDDKKRARLNCIADLLSRIPYEKIKRPKVKLPDRSDKHAYDDEAPMKHRAGSPNSTDHSLGDEVMSQFLRPEDLKKITDDAELEELRAAAAKRRMADQAAEDLKRAFEARELDPKTPDRINSAVAPPAARAAREILVLRFPAELLQRRAAGADQQLRARVAGHAHRLRQDRLRVLQRPNCRPSASACAPRS
jgi:hypothetical protein